MNAISLLSRRRLSWLGLWARGAKRRADGLCRSGKDVGPLPHGRVGQHPVEASSDPLLDFIQRLDAERGVRLQNDCGKRGVSFTEFVKGYFGGDVPLFIGQGHRCSPVRSGGSHLMLGAVALLALGLGVGLAARRQHARQLVGRFGTEGEGRDRLGRDRVQQGDAALTVAIEHDPEVIGVRHALHRGRFVARYVFVRHGWPPVRRPWSPPVVREAESGWVVAFTNKQRRQAVDEISSAKLS